MGARADRAPFAFRMNIVLVLEQTLNGLQLGVMLFLMAAGLTLVFGIMNLVNLAHGSFYMVGAYLTTTFYQATGSFALGVLLGLAGTLVVGIVVERVALRTLYERDHLDQVLATFGLILFFNELMAILWGRARGACGPLIGPDSRGAAGNGRADPDRGLCRHRDRRHRLDPRRARRRPHRRHGGYARPGVRPADARDRALAHRRRHGGPGARLDADLPADGDRARLAAARAVSRARMNSRTRAIVLASGLALLAAVPPLAGLLDQPFYLDLVRRVMIFAIAALSLNLILGYGGMISFGHAAYLGIGAYAVGVLAHYGIDNGFLQWALAIGASALVALAIGAVSIRTSGVYFIMITLAFTQMLYYLGISIEEFGGDDGMRLAVKSQFGLIDLNNTIAFYYLVLAILVLFLFLGHRLVNSRFGMVIRAARSNEARTRSIGFSPYPYRLAAFVIAGAMCGRAGALAPGFRALVPDHQHLRRFHRARERDARGAGARRLELSLLERCARRACAAGARAAGARGGGLGRARRVAGGEPRARRAASARDRDGARDAPAADAAR